MPFFGSANYVYSTDRSQRLQYSGNATSSASDHRVSKGAPGDVFRIRFIAMSPARTCYSRVKLTADAYNVEAVVRCHESNTSSPVGS
jgi:hypothetical protein